MSFDGVDIGALARALLPETPAEAHEAAVAAGGAALDRLRRDCDARLEALQPWALETLHNIYRELDEPETAEVFAERARGLSAVAGGRRWQDAFPSTLRRQERRPLPTLDDCTPLDVADVAARLGPGGALARAIHGYEPRPGQIKMLSAVVSAFNGGKHLMAEAGTGIGKSIAYLLPAAFWARLNDIPVVISTNTKNLQSQLVEKDLPAVLKVLDAEPAFAGRPISAAVIKGRANYLCLRRFGQMLDGGMFELQRPELRMFAAVVAWACASPDGDFDSIAASGAADPQFLSMLASGSDECRGRSCRNYSRCFVQLARARSLAANLVVANHSLVFAELDAEVPVSLPPHAQLIFDEAHNLEDAATSHFTLELSTSAVSAVTRRLCQVRGRTRRGVLPSLAKRLADGAIRLTGDSANEAPRLAGSALDATAALDAAAARLCQTLAKVVGEKGQTLRYSFQVAPDGKGKVPDQNPLWRAVDAQAASFQDAASALRAALKELADTLDDSSAGGERNLAAVDTADLRAAIGRIDELRENAEFIINGCFDDSVFWVERGRGRWRDTAAAYAAPVNVGPYLASQVYARKSSVILCSATLSVAGSFSFMASRLGLDLIDHDRLAVCTAPSPFDYARQCALVVPEYLSPPDARDRPYAAELSELVLRLAERYGGRTMVLFTSYEMMRQCAELVRAGCGDGGFSLLVQGESGSRNRMTSVFRQDGRCILFGTQSFWEGVDVMGEALSCVVVARLPFPSPGDPIVSARCERIDREGGSSFAQYSVPLAVLKLRQGFGRLIRHRLDHGSVVIADTRVVSKGYGRTFLRSLPVAPVRCASPDAVMAALK